MWPRLLLVLLVVSLLAGALLYSQWSQDDLRVSGFIEADEIRLGSRVGGRVQEVLVEEGQRVSAGDKLLKLAPYDLQERRQEAAAQLQSASVDLARLKAGYRPEEVAQAQARRDRLTAQLDKLRAGPRRQEIAAAQAYLDAAHAQLELAQISFKRIKDTLARNAAAVVQADFDKATEELKNAQAMSVVRSEELALLLEGTRPEDIREAEAQLEEAEQAYQLAKEGFRQEDIQRAEAAVQAATAAVETVDRQLEELTIYAPADGAIEALDLQPGDLVAPNAPVLSMMDTSHLWIRAYVPEDQLGLKLGQKIWITVDSFAGESFVGHISFIARQAEFTPNNVQTPEERSKQVFRIKVELDEGLDRLRPGMAGDVWLTDPGTRP